MAQSIIRPAPVYKDGKKVAEVREGTYEVDSNDVREITSEGYIGHTDGATTSMMQMTMVVPVEGLSITALPDMLAKKYVKIGVFTDGHMHLMEGRIVKMSYTWNYEKGEMRCTGHFESGQPQLA